MLGTNYALRPAKKLIKALEMDFVHRSGPLCAATTLLWCVAAHAHQHANAVSPADGYDLRRLNYPSAAELASEEKGRIHIYDSLEINAVNAALDQNFERIQNMMFVRINHLPAAGYGPADVEDDGCE